MCNIKYLLCPVISHNSQRKIAVFLLKFENVKYVPFVSVVEGLKLVVAF